MANCLGCAQEIQVEARECPRCHRKGCDQCLTLHGRGDGTQHCERCKAEDESALNPDAHAFNGTVPE